MLLITTAMHLFHRGIRMGTTALLATACASSSPSERPVTPAPAATTAAAPAPAAAAVDAPALLAAARAALDAGDHAAARAGARDAFNVMPVEAGVLIAESHLSDDGDLAAAEAALLPAVNARHAAGISLMARVHENRGEAPAARALLESLLQTDANAALHERLAGLAMTEGALAQAQNNAPEMKAAFARAATHYVKARELGSGQPSYAMGEARALEAVGDLKGAEAALTRLLALLPEPAAAHAQLAAFHERHGQKDKAAAARKLAGEAAPPQKRKLRPLLPSAR